MAQQLRMIISGRVQHVGFRQFVSRYANAMALSGWVRNLYNGDVEVFVQGNEDTLSRFIDVCKKGPLFSKVTDVQFLQPDAEALSLFQDGAFLVLSSK